MSGHDHSAFFGDYSIEKYFDSLNPGQQEILDDFYYTNCVPAYKKRFIQKGKDPTQLLITYGRTCHNLFVAAQWTHTAHRDPADFSITTCQKQGTSMVVEKHSVVEVRHAVGSNPPTLERIIYAKGETSSRLVGLELGKSAMWLEKVGEGNDEHLRRLPLEHFVLPPR